MQSNQSGWIKLHRKVLTSAIFENPRYLKLWVAVLTTAQHEEKKILFMNTEVTLKKGQFIFGAPSWAKRYKIPETTVTRFVTFCKKAGMLTVIKSGSKVGTIYQITNWSFYQILDTKTDTIVKNKRLPSGERTRMGENGKKKRTDVSKLKLPPVPKWDRKNQPTPVMFGGNMEEFMKADAEYQSSLKKKK